MPARSFATWAIVLASCGSGVTPPSRSGDELRVLFIGNSLTAANELPRMIEALAVSLPARRLSYGTVVESGFSLEDHWNAGRAQQAIARGGWDVVVLQQGPSGLPESRAQLIMDTKRFDTLIGRVGARTALYMVWPDVTRPAAFDSVSAAYRDAAEAVHGMLVPAGDAWQAAWRRDRMLPLYSDDGFHPSVEGSYLAALVFVARLFDAAPVALPSTFAIDGRTIEIAPQVASLLQSAAAEVTTDAPSSIARPGATSPAARRPRLTTGHPRP